MMIKFFRVFAVFIFTFNFMALAAHKKLSFNNDTLNKTYFDSLSYKLYPSPGGGYVSGNNAYGDKVKAQEFHAGNQCNIYGVLLHFGHKKFTSLSDSSFVMINYYHLNGTGTSTISNTAPCPGNIFFTDSIKVSEIDTINGNVLNYASPLYTDSNFVIGLSFDKLKSMDTVALFTNKDGDAGNREQSWEQVASGNWYTLKYNWPLNADYALFPIVNTSVGLSVVTDNTTHVFLSPNPSTAGSTRISIPSGDIINIQVYNAGLQLIKSSIQPSDEKSTLVEFDSTGKGIYFVKIKTAEFITVKKLLVN